MQRAEQWKPSSLRAQYVASILAGHIALEADVATRCHPDLEARLSFVREIWSLLVLVLLLETRASALTRAHTFPRETPAAAVM
jgi:hypothetical protein